MNEEPPSLADVQALAQDDLEAMVSQLFRRTREPVTRAEPPAQLRVTNPDAIVVVTRAPLGGPPLAGIALTAVRRAALSAGVGEALVVTTGVYSAGQRAEINRAIEMLPDVHLEVLEGFDLIDLIADDPEVRRTFFPSAAEAAATARARRLPRALIAAAEWAAPQRPDTAKAGIFRYRPLVTTIIVLVTLIALPITVDSTYAIRVGVIGLAVLLAGLAGGTLLGALFERPRGLWRASPFRALLFVPDHTSLYRGMQRHPSWSSVYYGGILFVAAFVFALRAATQTILLLFFAIFGFALLLLWGIDPAVCDVGTADCAGAFAGAGAAPTVGDFLYLAVHGGLLNQPADLEPVSRVARALITAEFVLAAALIGSYAVMAGLADRISAE